jgi:hypothetical protein
MKQFVRAIALVPVLALVGVTSSSALPLSGYCVYQCYNPTTGKTTTIKNQSSFGACCGGPWFCPAGSTVTFVDATPVWMGPSGPQACVGGP